MPSPLEKGDAATAPGDFDPSGINAGENIEETLKEMAPDAEIYFERIAVNPRTN
jgi:hypothetical protein